MWWLSVKYVPQVLTDQQNQWQFLATKNQPVVSHPYCLPDLAPCFFFLFLRMKLQL